MTVVEKYRDQKRQNQTARSHRFNILWSNTEVQSSAVFQGNVQPDIRRRFRTADPMGKEAATVIERTLAYMADETDLDSVMRRVVQDMLLPGRGVARVRYDYAKQMTPQPGPDGVVQMVPKITGEMVPVEYVDWRWFRRDPDADRWEDVTWIAWGGEMTRKQLKEAFGEKGAEVNLSATDSGEEDGDKKEDGGETVYQAARVWEIWNKTDKKVLFWCAGYQDGLLAESDPPVNLRGFFPCPRPIYAVETNDTLIPVPEYELWRDQAAELNKITDRIDKVVDAMRVRGVYDGAAGDEIARLFEAEDNALIPVENWPAFMEKHGLEGVIEWLPIDRFKEVLESLYVQRESVKQTIYEITGISDILRGASDARETATAQEIKSKFGSLRIERKRQEINRFCRDLMEMQAEIAAENFQPETLSMMTGTQVSPELIQLLRDDRLRSYRIDIETEDSLQVQGEQEKKAVIELLGGLTQFGEGAGMLIQSGLMSGPEVKAILMAGVRKFKLGKDVENAMEEGQAEAQNQPPKPDPKAQAEEAKAQAEQVKAQAAQQKVQGDMQLAQAKGEVEMQTTQAKAGVDAAKAQADMVKIQLQMQADQQAAALEMQRMQMELQKMRAEMDMAHEKGEIDREMMETKAKAQRAQMREGADT